MASAAELAVVITGQDKGASRLLNDLNRQGNALTRTLGNVATVASGFVLGAGLLQAPRVLGSFIDAAKEARTVQTQLNAVLASTNGVAGITIDELNKMSASLQKVSLQSDEAIGGAQALLLTFTNIGRDVMPGATQAVLDMSQAFGQDLQSSAIQLGKALNDPIQGLSALRRVGVSFTEEQVNVITAMQQTGNLAGAQALILQELTRQFGGSAAAAAAAEGPMRQLAIRWDEMKETIGGALLPVLNTLAGVLLANVIPAISNLGATVGPIVGVVRGVAAEIQHFFTLGAGGGELGGQFSIIATTAFELGRAFREDVTPAINGFREAVTALIQGLQGYDIGGELSKQQEAGFSLGETLRNDVGPAVSGVIEGFSNWFQSGQVLVTGIKAVIAATEALGMALVGIVATAFAPTIFAIRELNLEMPNTHEAFRVLTSVALALIFPITGSGQALAYLNDQLDALAGKARSVLGPLNDVAGAASRIAGSVGGLGGIANLVGSGASGLFRQHGGPVSAGRPYIVGERGPELFMPGSSGHIIPNGGGGGATINLYMQGANIYASDIQQANGGVGDMGYAVASALRARGVF